MNVGSIRVRNDHRSGGTRRLGSLRRLVLSVLGATLALVGTAAEPVPPATRHPPATVPETDTDPPADGDLARARVELDEAFERGDEAELLEICRRHRSHLRQYQVGFDSPLAWAVKRNASSLVRFLVDQGLAATGETPPAPTSASPLNLAVAGGQTALVRLLLGGGADPNEMARSETAPILAALQRVASRDGPHGTAGEMAGELILALLERGANLLGPASADPDTDLLAYARTRIPLAWLEFALTNARPEFQASASWNTLVHAAAGLGATHALHVFLSRGVSVTIRNRHGLHALHEVARRRSEPPDPPDAIPIRFAPSFLALDEGRSLPRPAKLETAALLVRAGCPMDAFAAAGLGDLAFLETAVRADPKSLAARDAEGRSLLHWAVLGNEPATVEWLAKRGADLSATNLAGQTPLHLAVAGWPSPTAPILLRLGAPLGITNRAGLNPLALAGYSPDATRLLLAHAGSLADDVRQAALRQLLTVPGDLRSRRATAILRDPRSPWASDTLRLVDLHLDAFRRFDPRGDFAAELLGLAFSTGEWNLAEALAARGVPTGLRDAHGDPVLWRLFERAGESSYLPPGSLACRLFEGLPMALKSWLHDWGLAPESPRWVPSLSAVDFVALAGCDVAATNAAGGSLLHSLARRLRPTEIAWLVDSREGLGTIPGGPVSRSWSARTQPDETRGSVPGLIRVLRAGGRDLEWRDRTGDTALLAAWRHGHPALARKLARLGANARATNALGENVLHLVCQPDHSLASAPDLDALVEELVGKGVDPNAVDAEGRTPLHRAVLHPQSDRLIPALMKSGAQLDRPDRRGITPRQLLDARPRVRDAAL